MFSFQNNMFNFGLFNSGKTQDVEDLSKFIHSEKHMQMRSTFWEYQDKFPEIDTLVQALAEKVLETSSLTKQEFNKCKMLLEASYKYDRIKNTVIIYVAKKLYRLNKISENAYHHILNFMRTKNTRSNSGILEVAIMTSPWNMSGSNDGCDYDCYMCPKQKGMPRSYIKEEPGTRRAIQNGFDCVKQFRDRCSTYLCHGQPVDKIEIIVLGGTWSSYEEEYQEKFCTEVYYAANTFYHGGDKPRKMKSLKEEQAENETAMCRIVGFTIETRPDQINEAEILKLNRYGITRVQLGVQTIHDHLLKKINRKCYHRHTIKAIRMLKESGFKVLIHIMPLLPDATPELDRQCLEAVAKDCNLKPDELKIYPTSVTTTSSKDETEVYTVIEKWYREGKYVPYPEADMKEVIKDFLAMVPPFMRISRIFRDIPVANITGGANVPNLRQYLETEMAEEERYCKCIRSREIRDEKFRMDEIFYTVEQYESSAGKEYFISANILPRYENIYHRTLIGFCRLLVPPKYNSQNHFQETLRNSCLIRELHVYGQLQTKFSSKTNNKSGQHRGIGKVILKMAEEIGMDQKYDKLSVISGVGVRGYYKKQGYHLENNYMVKYFPRKSLKERVLFLLYSLAFVLWLSAKVAVFYNYFHRKYGIHN